MVSLFISRDADAAARRYPSEGNVYLIAPYDDGVFHAPIEKGGVLVVSLIAGRFGQSYLRTRLVAARTPPAESAETSGR